MVRPCLVALVLLAGCTGRHETAARLEEIYGAAQAHQRHGDLAKAITGADHGAATAGRGSLWYWRFRLLKAEVLLQRGKAADALVLLPDAAPSPEIRARSLLYRGWAKYLQSDFPEAGRLFDEAERAASGSSGLIVSIRLRRAYLFVRLGRLAEAEKSFRESITAARNRKDRYAEAVAQGSFGFSLMNASRFDEAIDWFEKALAIAQPEGYQGITSTALLNLGWCYYKVGDLDRALQLYGRSEQLSREMGKVHDQQIVTGNMGGVYYARGDYAMAIRSYRHALALAQQNGEDFWSAKWLNNLATTLIEIGDIESAERYNRQALELQDRLRDARSRLWPLLNKALIAAARREYPQARRLLEQVIHSVKEDPAPRWEAQAALANVYVATGRFPQARAAFEDAIATVEAERTRLLTDESKLSFLSRLVRFYQDYVDFLMDRGESQAAFEVAESARARLLSEKLELGRAGTVADFRRLARASRSVLLSFWLAPRRSFVWVTTADRITAFPLPPEKDIREAVGRYETTLLSVRDPLEARSPAGQELFQTLIAPEQALIPAGSRVIVVPDGPLHKLNLETLPVPGATPHYWIRDVTLAVAPSLSVLETKPTPAPKQDSLLLIGDPLPAGQQFPALPNAGSEIAAIRRRFGGARVDVLTGAQATPAAYRQAGPGNFSIIHFAAHATANHENPLDSAVILSPGADAYKLYARDVENIPLHGSLVTISACRSAGAREFSGEGLVGFAWAFLQAGARSVIAGLWDVNDRCTAQLMDKLYAGLHTGADPATALRIAKLSLLDSGGAYRKPYYWAPFQVYTRVVQREAAAREPRNLSLLRRVR